MRKNSYAKSYHVSRLTFLIQYVISIVLLGFGLFAYFKGMSYAIFISSIGISALGFIVLETRIRSNKIILGNDNVSVESGLLSKNSIRIGYNNISDIRINQTFFQRIFGYGNIEMGVPGAVLQQSFAGRGDVKVETAGLHPGITLKKFQNVRNIEIRVLSKMEETRRLRR